MPLLLEGRRHCEAGVVALTLQQAGVLMVVVPLAVLGVVLKGTE